MNRRTMSLLTVIAINLAACCVGGVTPKKQAAVTDKQVKAEKNDDANDPKKETAKGVAEKDDIRDQLIPFLTKHGAPDGVETNEADGVSSDETTRALIYEKAKVAVVFTPRYNPPRKPPFGRWELDCFRDTETQAVIGNDEASRRLDAAKNAVASNLDEGGKPSNGSGKPTLPYGKKLDPDPFKHFVAVYGEPDSRGTTEKDVPKPWVITKWLVYKKEGVKIVFRPATGNDSAKPIREWRWEFSRYAYIDGTSRTESSAITSLSERANYFLELPETKPVEETKVVAKKSGPNTGQPQWNPQMGMNPQWNQPGLMYPSFSGMQGPVNVRGYYRQNGTYVQPYTRSR